MPGDNSFFLVDWLEFVDSSDILVCTYPGRCILLPKIVSGRNYNVLESLLGMFIFYAVIALLVYDHSTTDFFKVILLSFVVNSLLTILVHFSTGHISAHNS